MTPDSYAPASVAGRTDEAIELQLEEPGTDIRSLYVRFGVRLPREVVRPVTLGYAPQSLSQRRGGRAARYTHVERLVGRFRETGVALDTGKLREGRIDVDVTLSSLLLSNGLLKSELAKFTAAGSPPNSR